MDAIGHRGGCGKANEASKVGWSAIATFYEIDTVIVNEGCRALFLSLWTSTENERCRKLDIRLHVEIITPDEVH
jgi:hypothetical protein